MRKIDFGNIPQIKVPTTMEVWHSIAYKLLVRQIDLKAKNDISESEREIVNKIETLLAKFNNTDRNISREPQLFADMKAMLGSIVNADKEAANANN
jgi:hypothetical protein